MYCIGYCIVFYFLRFFGGSKCKHCLSQAWDNHLLRNRSIVVDLFHGQLKSCVRCLSCGHTSVRFDPFTYLSLPLPMDSCIHVEVLGTF